MYTEPSIFDRIAELCRAAGQRVTVESKPRVEGRYYTAIPCEDGFSYLPDSYADCVRLAGAVNGKVMRGLDSGEMVVVHDYGTL